MKKEALKQIFMDMENKCKHYRGNDTELLNLQYETNKIFIQIINDFNEKTEIYNRRLLFYTIVIALLTAVVAILTVIVASHH